METRKFLRRALQDPKLNIEVIIPREYLNIERALAKLPDDVLISEWLHTMGTAKYEYHIHREPQIKTQLSELYGKDIRGGNPKLVNLYSKKGLLALIKIGRAHV